MNGLLKNIGHGVDMKKWIDPPSGWVYGFPKEIPYDVVNVKDWLVENGYPRKVMDSMGKHFYCRYWETEE